MVGDSFYDELECMFDKFPKYHITILLGYFNAKVCREEMFKPPTGYESHYEGPGKPGWTEIVWDTSASALC
jgi:hypothetical protein